MWPTLRPGDEAVIQPVAASELQPGDWVVVRNAHGGFLHRYLGRRADKILTKGDHHRIFDPLWDAEALLGRVTEVYRDDRCIYRRTPPQQRRQRLLAWGHQWIGEVGQMARKLKGLLVILLLLWLGVPAVQAAVTVTGFVLELGAGEALLYWETASETDNLGFYVGRRSSASPEYERISAFIGSLDEGAGAFYEYKDTNVAPGMTYYYRLEDVPADGSPGSFFYPEPAFLTIPGGGGPGTPTPSPFPDPTLTPDAAATATPTPTALPAPSVRFWADPATIAAGDCTTLHWQAVNVATVYLDGRAVIEQGAQMVCPCEAETYTLRVTYLDGSAENFNVSLAVTGQCTDAQRTATATTTATPAVQPPPATPTIIPTSGPTATPTRDGAEGGPPPTATAPPLPAFTPTLEPPRAPTEAETPTPAAPSMTPTRASVQGDGAATSPQKAAGNWWMTTLLLLSGLLIGAGLIWGGIWFWKQQA